jgi:hypothetical protein
VNVLKVAARINADEFAQSSRELDPGLSWLGLLGAARIKLTRAYFSCMSLLTVGAAVELIGASRLGFCRYLKHGRA